MEQAASGVEADRAAGLGAAEAALATVVTDPLRAHEVATGVLAAAGSDHELASVALRVAGLAHKELGDVRAALRCMRRALQRAERGRLPRRAGQVRMSLVVLLADAGHSEAALAEAERAADVLTGHDAARLFVQRGLVLQRLARTDEALACFRRALPALRRRGDVLWECRTLINRGALHAYQGAHRAAAQDLGRCLELATAHDYDLMRTFALQNLGFAALRRGDVPEALASLDEAVRHASRLGRPTALIMQDRAEALLLAGLAHQARAALERAVSDLEGSRLAYDLAETRLMFARAALAEGDHRAARLAAEAAASDFSRQRRRPWAVLAQHVALAAREQSGECSPALVSAARRTADALERAGWHEAAAQSLLVGGRVALRLDHRERARQLLAGAALARRRGPASMRAVGWHAEALRRLSGGDRRGASAALRAGLRAVEENATVLGATDLRAHSAVHGAELALMGLRLAFARRRAAAALSWAESWRAGALRMRPVRPPGDHQLAADLAEFRRVASDIASATLAGRDLATLQARRLRLERAIRDRSRHARGGAAPARPPSKRALAEALDRRALVELIRLDGGLHAVTVVEGRFRLHALGAYQDALTELESLRFAMNRIARDASAPLREAALLTFTHAAGRLEAQLLAPLASEVGSRALVIVPTGALHALPWTVLPSCAGRPVSVAPSARTWLDAVRRRPSDATRTVLVAGPGLDHAEPEVNALTGAYPDAARLTGGQASVTAVSGAVDGAELAHIAAHGHFRSDNPLFSCLDLADGPLTVYDLERLRRTPRRLILSACESGLSDVRPGDELMGLASAVFTLGTNTLIASVTAVPDGGTRALMLELHRRLRAGSDPAAALAGAQHVTGVSGFVCFGAG
ncbi:MAG: CHAT domain-containing protein [Carbonactinosporaceae bacterium]